jgi:hypothetical protein
MWDPTPTHICSEKPFSSATLGTCDKNTGRAESSHLHQWQHMVDPMQQTLSPIISFPPSIFLSPQADHPRRQQSSPSTMAVRG